MLVEGQWVQNNNLIVIKWIFSCKNMQKYFKWVQTIKNKVYLDTVYFWCKICKYLSISNFCGIWKFLILSSLKVYFKCLFRRSWGSEIKSNYKFNGNKFALFHLYLVFTRRPPTTSRLVKTSNSWNKAILYCHWIFS